MSFVRHASAPGLVRVRPDQSTCTAGGPDADLAVTRRVRTEHESLASRSSTSSHVTSWQVQPPRSVRHSDVWILTGANDSRQRRDRDLDVHHLGGHLDHRSGVATDVPGLACCPIRQAGVRKQVEVGPREVSPGPRSLSVLEREPAVDRVRRARDHVGLA